LDVAVGRRVRPLIGVAEVVAGVAFAMVTHSMGAV
jgi:hypothetical protein